MSVQKPINIPGRRKVLTKNMILRAQEDTKSNMEASRWLSVSYNTYKKWAKYYDVFDQHNNQIGIGIKKGWSSYKIPIENILNGDRQPPARWSHSIFKKRMIDEGYIQEECSKCNYNETNLETQKVCLTLDFIDGDHKNFKFENIRLLCPNCYLAFNGYFHNSKAFCK
tara:strand:- start:44 stop:547 length:504 start_codon:yes stop_codon:yes gene_type:complete